jgi:hypothetical protein
MPALRPIPPAAAPGGNALPDAGDAASPYGCRFSAGPPGRVAR